MLEDRFRQDIDYIVKEAAPVTVRAFDASPHRSKVPASLAAIWERCGIAI